MGKIPGLFVAIAIVLLFISTCQVDANSKNLKFEDEPKPKVESQTEKSEPVEKDPFDGLVPKCEIFERGCIPMNNFTFTNGLPNTPKEALVQVLNKKLLDKKYGSPADLEFKMKNDGNIGLFAKKKFLSKSKVLVIPIADALTSDTLDLSLFSELPENLKLLKYHKLPSYAVRNKSIENFISSQFLQFSTQVLLHLYNPETSLLKDEFSLFARELSDMVVLDLEKDELELLDESLKTRILNERYILREGYKVFLFLMREFWSNEQINYFFKRLIVPYEDFVYTYYLYKTKTWSINLKNIPPFALFVPLFSIPDNLMKIKFINAIDYILTKGEKNEVIFAAQTNFDIEEGEEILFDYADSGSNLETILFRGFVPKENLRECIDVEAMNKELADTWGVRNVICINSQTLKLFYALGNIINMDIGSLTECRKYYDSSKGYDYKVVYEKCNHPEWSKVNLWISFRKNLKELKDKYTQIVKNLNEKLVNSQRKSILLLVEYYNTRIKIIDDTLLESENIEEFNKNLKGGKAPEGSKIMKDEL